MKKFSFIYMILALIFCGEAFAAGYGRDAVGVRNVDLRRRGDAVDVAMDLVFDRLVLRNDEQLTVTPVIVSGMDTVALPPVVFRGEVFDIIAHRRAMFYDEHSVDTRPYRVVVFSRSDRREREQALQGHRTPVQTREDVINYTGTFLYPVPDNADLVLVQELEACGYHDIASVRQVGSVVAPVPALISFLIPVDLEVAPRKAKLTAHINFDQDKYVVRPEIASNRTELQKIYDFTHEMLSDEDIEVRRIVVRSYASPEATYAYNTRLSQRRAEAVRDNVIDRMDLDGAMFSTESVPEDWDSLRTWIAQSDIASKSRLLDIIDHVSDPDVREARIKEADPATYRMLYNNVYPNLRRTDIEIEYDLTPVTLERALVLIETDPSKMRMDNMMQVAEYYGRESKDYERAMLTILKHYPYEVEPNNNMGALALMNGDTYSARQYLERYADHPQCLNNLGVAAYWDGDVDKAEECFRRAAEMGCKEAAHNLENLAYLEY